jgi:hypothetical protein
MRRRIGITVDCGDETCGECHLQDDNPREGVYCPAFIAVLERKDNKIDEECLRCAECLERDEGRLD